MFHLMCSDMVMAAQSLINQLKIDLDSTEVAQARVQQALSLLGITLDPFGRQLQQVYSSVYTVHV